MNKCKHKWYKSVLAVQACLWVHRGRRWRLWLRETQTWCEQFACTEEADGQSHDGRFVQVWADAMRQRQLMCELVEHLRLLTPPTARCITRLLFPPFWRMSVETGQRSKVNTIQSTAGGCQGVCQTSPLYLKQDDYSSGLDCTVAQSQNVWWSFSVRTWADRYYFLFIHYKMSVGTCPPRETMKSLSQCAEPDNNMKLDGSMWARQDYFNMAKNMARLSWGSLMCSGWAEIQHYFLLQYSEVYYTCWPLTY